MLTREQAAEQLKRFAAPTDAGSKPGRRRLMARLRVDPLSDELEQWLEPTKSSAWPAGRADAFAADLDGLDAKRRARLLTDAAPQLGPALARWWVWSQLAPYQHGWARRGFRTANAQASRSARLQHLRSLVWLARRWPQDTAWFAAWASHLNSWRGGGLSELLASEIDAGDTDIADTLLASALGRHPVSGITVVGVQALLGCRDPERWEQIVTLLRNAGRQEGLRSVVLEAVDLAHPDAFTRVLDVVVSDNLARFAGTARAAGVWFGEEIDVRNKALPGALAELRELVGLSAGDAAAGLAADVAAQASPQRLFLRLWAMALRDALAASAAAADLLAASPDPQVRLAAARILAELGLVASREALRGALADDDHRVYANAVSAWPARDYARDRAASLDESMVGLLLERVRTLGKERRVETGIIGSRPQAISSSQAADVILAHRTLAAAPAEAVKAASADGRYGAVRVLAQAPLDNRAALFGFLLDASSMVRGVVVKALLTLPTITAAEALLLESALRRKASDLRRAAVMLLLKQPMDDVRATVTRLLDGTADQARAAAEIEQEAGLAVTGTDGVAADGAGDPGASPTVRVLGHDLPAVLVPRPGDRTPAVAVPPPGRPWEPFHPGCRLIVTSLRAWLSEHSDVEVQTHNGVELLSNLRWLPPVRGGEAAALPEIVAPWWERIAPTLTDGGVELMLLIVATPHLRPHMAESWARAASARVLGPIPAAQHEPALVWPIIRHLATAQLRASWVDVVIDAAQTLFQGLPLAELAGPPATMSSRGRTLLPSGPGSEPGDARLAFVSLGNVVSLDTVTTEQLARLWRLARYLDEPEGTLDVVTGPTTEYRLERHWDSEARTSYTVFDQPWRAHPSVELTARAVAAGCATHGDLVDALLDLDRPFPRAYAFTYGGPRAAALPRLSGRRPPEWGRDPVVVAAVEQVRAAAIDGELARGELTARLTAVARDLRSASGIAGVVRLLSALGSRPFARGYAWTDSRESSLSRLVRIHFPAAGETAQQLSDALTAARIREKRAVEFGVYAPQWAAMIEQHLGWPGFESAVWWVHAHTKDESWTVDSEIRDEWASAVAQRTPLDSVDLTRGAADVAWFGDIMSELGEERFTAVLSAAKYASTAGGHKRAELFAHALLGRLDQQQLTDRIDAKRHQDSVRALGLLPVSGLDDPAVLERYRLLRGFVASDRTSGSARRASETTAATIGMENLARTAGYRDPGRLTWAMEADAVRDLADGPVTASDGTVTVTLALGDAGSPELTVVKNDKALKAVPAAAAKNPEIAALRSRVTELRAQARRMRASLEQSCVSGERFEVREIAELLAHPVLAPMLRELVLISDEGLIGFASLDADRTSALIGSDGSRQPLDGSPLRIAHPVDLLASGQWPALQRAAFGNRMTQPFRQLFRELYVPTAAELDEAPRSRRYAGQQVEQRRAAGLFTSRGWVADFEVGFGRTFHAEKITAWCGVLGTFGTPGEAEDATVEDVTFTPAGKWEPLPVGDVPARLFSEVMRDLDLVVSVAHAGGVDPETSESSVAMRGRLVEETADMLSMDNVEVTDHHALVRGTLGRYSVHLGSGQVHRVPGNAICIIPISAQHRGRVFLPFADDDPRTAEVISKVLLLARDDRIQDPTILEQLT